MPTFAYRAVDAAGRRSRGQVSASTSAAAARELETRGLLTLDMREAVATESSGGFASGSDVAFSSSRAESLLFFQQECR